MNKKHEGVREIPISYKKLNEKKKKEEEKEFYLKEQGFLESFLRT